LSLINRSMFSMIAAASALTNFMVPASTLSGQGPEVWRIQLFDIWIDHFQAYTEA